MIRRAVAIAALAVLAGLPAAAAAATPTAPEEPAVQIRTTRAVGDTVQVVAQAADLPPGAPPPEAAVSAGGRTVPARNAPLLANDASLVLVFDAVGEPQDLADGRSGLTSLLLQVAPELPTGVVADGNPPRLAAAVEPGVADDVGVLTNLPATSTRSTGRALTEALAGQPADRPPRTIVLWTGAGDAGGESAADLSARLEAANTVLVVVAPKVQTSGYWASVAHRTGGFVTAPSPGERAVRAFDRLSDVLRSSYVVTFDRPAASGEAQLRWAPPGTRPVSLPFALPAAGGTPAAGRRPPAEADEGPPVALIAAGVGLLLVLAGVGTLALRQRRPPAPPPPPPPMRAADVLPKPSPRPPKQRPPASGPTGVRVFDLRDERPKEIGAGDLFEPRAARDARERAERSQQSPEERREGG